MSAGRFRRAAAIGLLWTGAAQAGFVEVTGSGNPFNGVDVGDNSAPAFVDIDNDGDLDAFIGDALGTISFYRNTGSSTAATFVLGAPNPFNGSVGQNSAPTFADLDGDGDKDALVGEFDGVVNFYRNIGTASSPVFALETGTGVPFNGLDLGMLSKPTIGDLDGDGDFDVVVGLSTGGFRYFRNTGTATAPAYTEITGASNPLNGVDIGNRAAPALVDLDSDGDLDLVAGKGGNNVGLIYFLNTGSSSSPAFTEQTGSNNPFDGINAGTDATPALVDIDGDGDKDLFTGEDVGTVRHFNNQPAVNEAGRFNAIEVSGNPITGRLNTKIAGTAFDLDIVAINPGGNDILPGYRGTVTIQLWNAIDDSGTLDSSTSCRSSWTLVQTLGSLTFTATDNGRKTLSGITYSDALRAGRLYISDATAGIAGCSTDAFAIRPNDFLVEARDSSASTAGTSRLLNATTDSGTPTHKAGQYFTVLITARNSAGATTAAYNGSPTITATGSVLGSTFGTVSFGAWTSSNGVLQNDLVTYSEAGAFALQVEDISFASVDSTDSTLAQRQIGPSTGNAGRFTPDHFVEVSRVTPEFVPGCSSFTYMGQAFRYQTAPQVTVRAVAAGGTTTTNYAGTLFKLDDAVATIEASKSYIANSGTFIETSVAPEVTVTELAGAEATVTFDAAAGFRLTLDRPSGPAPDAYTLEGRLQANITDADGVTTTPDPFTFGDTTSGNGVSFGVATAKEVRYGRLRLFNAYGSELLPLDVPLRVEYQLDSASGFVTSENDSCTIAAGIAISDATFDQFTGLSAGDIGLAGVTISNGLGFLRLSAPNPTGTGRARVTLNLLPSYPWLQPDEDADSAYDDNPTAQASYGLYGDDKRRVYLREFVR